LVRRIATEARDRSVDDRFSIVAIRRQSIRKNSAMAQIKHSSARTARLDDTIAHDNSMNVQL